MPRLTPVARAAEAWKTVVKPKPPRHLSPAAKAVWKTIVGDRRGDWFRPSNLHLLEQLCETIVAQRAALAELRKSPTDKELVQTVGKLGSLTMGLSRQLRITVQADVDRRSRKADEQEPQASPLLGGWKRPA
jgi:phage terminase small subunit